MHEFVARNEGIVMCCGDGCITVVLVVGRVVAAAIVERCAIKGTVAADAARVEHAVAAAVVGTHSIEVK